MSGANEKTDFVTPWMVQQEIVNLLNRGDLVEFHRTATFAGRKRRIYTHWGLFYGFVDDVPLIVHMSNEDGDFEGSVLDSSNFASVADSMTSVRKIAQGSRAEVRFDPLSRVAGGDLLRVNNSLDSDHRPFPTIIILDRATQKLGEKGYNVMSNNCEHFVKWARYGIKYSEQAVLAKSFLLSSVLAIGLNPLVAAGAGIAYAVTSDPISRTINRVCGTNFALF
ncbi:unnamed protein product [Caenorhabditis auriculariae]|uniref:LRAT domain-containing protein n=1 Tax=Caenorhabditis auriculariae TaxID=2777116 RepID=A0A8S1HKX1_9PELO|nr:unnamed protein product [Caenorhabditis auriculariae]